MKRLECDQQYFPALFTLSVINRNFEGKDTMTDYQMPLNPTRSPFMKSTATTTENKNWKILKSMQLMMNILLNFESNGMSIKIRVTMPWKESLKRIWVSTCMFH